MKFFDFAKRNIVLTVAWILAVVSMFFVVPGVAYLDYIDFRTLLILWNLMLITGGLMEQGVFRILSHKLVGITENERQLGIVLILLCFFLSMIITNDVALITFVPFTIYIFYEKDNKENLIYILILETIGANLGSMLTPIGNPQNLYLYNLSGMNIGEFIGLMLPYSVASLGVILVLSVILLKRFSSKDEGITLSPRSINKVKNVKVTILFCALLILAITVVLRIISVYILTAVTLICFLGVSKGSIKKVDYSLIFTFIGFFIFVGNMGRIHFVSDIMEELVRGHEMAAGIISSQFISNVPAALLLSNFTDALEELVKGVNLGGLGTLIASMASLITFKFYANENYAKKNRYLVLFTVLNLILLAVLVLVNMMI